MPFRLPATPGNPMKNEKLHRKGAEDAKIRKGGFNGNIDSGIRPVFFAFVALLDAFASLR